MKDFLEDLKAGGCADLNAVMTTLNDARLCREVLTYWRDQGWVEVARSMPLVALRGERFSWDLSLHAFCGEAPAEDETEDPVTPEDPGRSMTENADNDRGADTR